MNFEQALAYLLRLGHETQAMKFGLENTEHLLDALGEPHLTYPKVQIAGTNGKGSTAVMLDAICRAAGISTGLYTSPHLVNITERIRINGCEITKEDFARLTSQVADTAQQLCQSELLPGLPTFFEHVTVIALQAFRDVRVDLGILETGLGGRLDATTAARSEIVVLTPVGLDHQDYLGETIREIAAEKAAVIRTDTVVVIAPQPSAVLNVILKRCMEQSVRPVLVNPDVRITDVDHRGRVCASFTSSGNVYENVRLNLPGRHQAVNASVAIAVAEQLSALGFDIPRDAIIHGLGTAVHHGRLEWRKGKPSFLFDGAHNVAGAAALRAYLDEFVDVPITLVFGAMRDKDLPAMVAELFPPASRIILTEIDNPRSASSESLIKLTRLAVAHGPVELYANSDDALRAAIEQTSPDEVICVTGSLYLIGEVMTSGQST